MIKQEIMVIRQRDFEQMWRTDEWKAERIETLYRIIHLCQCPTLFAIWLTLHSPKKVSES
jgi:hypothetical protein